MSPRHFSKAMAHPTYNKDIKDKVKPGMNIWFAFFAISGLDKTITKMFVFTPEEITNNPVKDSHGGIKPTSD